MVVVVAGSLGRMSSPKRAASLLTISSGGGGVPMMMAAGEHQLSTVPLWHTPSFLVETALQHTAADNNRQRRRRNGRLWGR